MSIHIAQLPYRGIIEIQGEDKADFLQGLITNDITQVTPEKSIYACLLSPQGRFLFDLFIQEKDGAYLLEAESSRLESLLKKLSLYKLRRKVDLMIRSDLKVFALWGEDLPHQLNLVDESGFTHKDYFMDPRLTDLGARAYLTATPDGFQSATPYDYDLHRLGLGVPEGGRDLIPEKSILLESGMDELNAISWTKGCYMGQELTARTKFRGLVRKRILPVIIHGGIPKEGDPIYLGDQTIGEMRTHNADRGLAILRIDDALDARELDCGNARLEPYIPSWMIIGEA